MESLSDNITFFNYGTVVPNKRSLHQASGSGLKLCAGVQMLTDFRDIFQNVYAHVYLKTMLYTHVGSRRLVLIIFTDGLKLNAVLQIKQSIIIFIN